MRLTWCADIVQFTIQSGGNDVLTAKGSELVIVLDSLGAC